MEKQHPLTDLMGTAMEKIRTMVDANTIIGTPIQTGDVTLIPVSRLSFGIASGGSDFTTKNQKPEADNSFGGGSGASAKLEPVAFLIIRGERQAAAGGASSGNHGGPGHRGGPRGGGQGDGVLGEAAGEEGTARSGRGGIRLRGRSAGDKQESGGAYWTHPNDEVMGIETPSGRGGGPSAVSEYPAHGPWDGHLRRLRHPDGGRERAGPL